MTCGCETFECYEVYRTSAQIYKLYLGKSVEWTVVIRR
jgi:hypothetical protein